MQVLCYSHQVNPMDAPMKTDFSFTFKPDKVSETAFMTNINLLTVFKS